MANPFAFALPIGQIFEAAGNAPTIGGSIIGAFQDHSNQVALNNAETKAMALAERDYQIQKEFAQHGVRWRVEDAKAAGINPVYALGGSGATASPVFSALGQDMYRAEQAQADHRGRFYGGVQRGRSELADLLQFGLTAFGLAQSQVGPAQPALYDPQPSRKVALDPSAPGREPGSMNDYAFARRGDKWFITKSKDITEATEDDLVQQTLWAIRNQLVPLLPGGAPMPPSDRLLPGHEWHWNGVYYSQRPIRPESGDARFMRGVGQGLRRLGSRLRFRGDLH